MAPQSSLGASSKLTMGITSVPNMVVVDLHASVETPVCDVQELTFKVSGTFGMPGLTDGQSCLSKLTDLCIPCGVDFGWDKLLPTIACELTQPSLLSGQWTIPELTYVMDITQKDLFIKLSYLAKTAAAAPEVASMPTLTGSDIT